MQSAKLQLQHVGTPIVVMADCGCEFVIEAFDAEICHLRHQGSALHVVQMEQRTTIDALLDGKLMLEQPAKGHRAGTDALLLAAMARNISGVAVADFGAGVGTAGLALALLEPARRMVLVELDEGLAQLAKVNISRNQLHETTHVLCADLTSPAAMNEAGLRTASIDLVMMNPPFLDSARARLSPLAQRRSSHAMKAGNLALWMKAARRVLRPHGHVALVHRADALGEIIAAMQPGFGALTIRPIYPREGEVAHRLLITARLGSKTPTVILPGLVLHQNINGSGAAFTPKADAIHRNLDPISMF